MSGTGLPAASAAMTGTGSHAARRPTFPAAAAAGTIVTAVTFATGAMVATVEILATAARAVMLAIAVTQGIAEKHVRPRARARSAIMTSWTGVVLLVRTPDQTRARMALGPIAATCCQP